MKAVFQATFRAEQLKSRLYKLKQEFLAFDYLMAVLVVGLSAFGVLMIQTVANQQVRLAALPANQLFHVITGTVLMLILAAVDYRFIARFFIPIFALCFLLLAAVLIIGPDPITNTARWIRIPLPGGLDMSLQPSEITKLGLIIFLAQFADRQRERLNRPLWLLLYLGLSAIPIAMVYLGRAFSASTVLLAIALAILFVGGLYFRTIIISTLLLLPAAALFYFDMLRQQPLILGHIMTERQLERIHTFFHGAPSPAAEYQTARSLFAVGSGGLSGQGFDNILVRVPHAHNDFVFSAVAEQFGFVGSAILLGVMALLIGKCLLVAFRAGDNLGRLIAAGVAGKLIFETFVNVGVATAMLPNTGMPFPFLSYGGTSMWVHMAAMGLVLNISLTSARERRLIAEEAKTLPKESVRGEDEGLWGPVSRELM